MNKYTVAVNTYSTTDPFTFVEVTADTAETKDGSLTFSKGRTVVGIFTSWSYVLKIEV